MDFDLIAKSLPDMLKGVAITLELLVLSLIIGACLCAVVVPLRLSRHRILWMPTYAYIFFFRGTPLLIQLYLIYYGLGQFHDFWESIGLWFIFKDGFWPAIITFSLNTAAYTSEILRGAILGLPHGEIEAAKACGMSRLLLLRRIILPKTARLVLPAYSNEVIQMMLSTSLASLVTIYDLMGVTKQFFNRTYAVYTLYPTAGFMYLLMMLGLTWLFRSIEFRLSAHLRDRPSAAAATGEPLPALTPTLR